MEDKNNEMPHVNRDFALRLEAIIDTAIDGIITINNKGIIETMNPAAAQLFGYAPAEVIGNNINMLMPNPYHREHDHYIDRYNTTRVPHIIGVGREVKGKRKDSTIFPFRLAVSEVVLNDRVIFTGIIHDMSDVKEAQAKVVSLNKELEAKVSERTYALEKTVNKLLSTNQALENEVLERKKAEEQLKKSQDELESALENEKELNELKSRFVSMASHEFRTPLTSILSSAAIIKRYVTEEQQPNREKHIDRIKSSVANLTGILNDFLSLSKLEEGMVETQTSIVNMEELYKDVIGEVQGMLKAGQKVVHQLNLENNEIEIDERILRNILFNLISNAIKYSEGQIDCKVIQEGGKLRFTITDSGIGIPEADQKYLFTRFFRAGNVTNIQGTGLGLNIVKRYVEILNGEISFESIQEKGTTFTVEIPMTKEDK